MGINNTSASNSKTVVSYLQERTISEQ